MTLSERIDLLCIRVAKELKKLRQDASSGSGVLNGCQCGKVVFDTDLILNKRVDEDWRGLVNGRVANSSLYLIRFPVKFKNPPVVLLTQERAVASWRFLELREVTSEYAVIGSNYWGNDLTVHWMAMGE